MKRRIVAAVVGFLAGVGVQSIAALAVSAYLRLGYFMPCPVFLPEILGGELRATLCQMLLSARSGARRRSSARGDAAGGINARVAENKIEAAAGNSPAAAFLARRISRSPS